MSGTTNRVSAGTILAEMPEWKREIMKPIKHAVYSAAIGASDELIRELVDATLIEARRDLSS